MCRGQRALRRWNRLAWLVLVFLVALLVYGRTLAATLTWQHDGADGGDLIAAAATLGVPHPSGYPVYVLLARLFLLVLPGELAVRVHWLSALCGAAAAVLVGLCVAEGLAASGSLKRPHDRAKASAQQAIGNGDAAAELSLPRWLPEIVCASTALTLAFSPLLWGQATIAEVHALHAALVAVQFWLLLRWRRTGHLWAAMAVAVLAGMALGNHLTSALLLPLSLAWLLGYGRRNRLAGRKWLGLLLGFLSGLLVYLYLPVAAARQPAVNWGDPRTWERFWWLVSGRLYQGVAFGVPLGSLPGRLSAWASLLVQQFGWWGWALALVGIWRLSQRDRPVLAASLYAFIAFSVYALMYDRADSYVYLLPAVLMMGYWWGQGILAAAEMVYHWGRGRAAPWLTRAVLMASAVGVLLLPLVPLARNFRACDLSEDREAADYLASVYAAAVPGALIISSGDRSTFALWYGTYALEERPDLAIVNANLWTFDWYRRTLATHHPDVALVDGDAPPRDLRELIEDNLQWRPVYVTEDARPVAVEFAQESSGPLFQLHAGEDQARAGRGAQGTVALAGAAGGGRVRTAR